MRETVKKKSIRKKIFRLTLITALVSVVIVCAMTIGGTLYLRENTVRVYSDLSFMVSMDSLDVFLNTATSNAEKLIQKRAELSDAKFTAWQTAARLLAESVRVIAPGDLQDYLESVAENTDNVTAAYIGMEAGDFIITSGDNVPDDFDPRVRPWYTAAKETGGMVWTDVYEDAAGSGLIITCAAPFYNENGTFAGVAGIDASLDDLVFLINEGKSWESETSFILNTDGETVISGGAPSDAPWNDIWEFLSQADEEIFADIESGMTGVSSVYFVKTDDKYALYIIAYTTMETLPWKIITLIDIDEVYLPAEVMMGNINELTESSVSSINTTIFILIGAFAAIFVVVIVAVSFISRRFTHTLTKPIMALQDGVADIAQGNLDREIDIRTNDEIEDLGRSVGKMALDLKDYIANLTAVTAEKERIGTELNIATQIQKDMLPSIFPAFPERDEFDIYATMQPAKEVGGDFYDFFLIDDDHLGIVMADVSGKSVPAALFMVIAKTLINNRARNKEAPEDVFINVNSQLCEGNETAMFVTAWFGVLEISSGKMSFVNAGHNPPLLKKADGSFEYLKTKKGFVLAGMNGFQYKQLEMTLDKGDTLYLYTDGVTEANNNADELYGEERLQRTLNSLSGLPLTEMLAGAKADIDLFADGAPQFDDITMLALRISQDKTSEK